MVHHGTNVKASTHTWTCGSLLFESQKQNRTQSLAQTLSHSSACNAYAFHRIATGTWSSIQLLFIFRFQDALESRIQRVCFLFIFEVYFIYIQIEYTLTPSIESTSDDDVDDDEDGVSSAWRTCQMFRCFSILKSIYCWIFAENNTSIEAHIEYFMACDIASCAEQTWFSSNRCRDAATRTARDPKLKDKYEIWQQKLRCFVRHRMNYAHRGSVERWRRRRQRQGIKLQTINTICTWPLSISIAVRLKHLFARFISSSVCILRRCASITCIVCVYVRGLRFSVQIYFTLTRKWSVSFALPRSVIPCAFSLTHSLLYVRFPSLSTENGETICSSKLARNLHMQIRQMHSYETHCSTSHTHTQHRDSWQASGADCDRKKEDESVCADKTEKIVCMPNDNNANSLFFLLPLLLCLEFCRDSERFILIKRVEKGSCVCICGQQNGAADYRVCIANRFNCICRGQRRNVDQMKLNGTEAFYWACNARWNGQRATDIRQVVHVCCALYEVKQLIFLRSQSRFLFLFGKVKTKQKTRIWFVCDGLREEKCNTYFVSFQISTRGIRNLFFWLPVLLAAWVTIGFTWNRHCFIQKFAN